MNFFSILWEQKEINEVTLQPEWFPDLNLDQVIQAITARKQEYNLKPLYYTPPNDLLTIRYRQEIARDLSDEGLIGALKAFAEQMVRVRRYLALSDKLDYRYHQEGWFLEAALVYGKAMVDLGEGMSSISLSSRGLLAFREFLHRYLHSQAFETFFAEAKKVKEALQRIRYCIILQNGTVRVRRYEGEVDYSIEVEKTFAKFKQGAVKDYHSDLSRSSGMNHVEAQILDFVARLYPEEFAALDRFYRRQQNFVDETIARFDREIQFYLAYLDFMAEIQRKGLSFCLPQVVAEKDIAAHQTFDLALAHTLRFEKQEIVPNDFYLRDSERVIIITGPNQGGKTTFARMFGQLHYLAKLGLPVPGREARLFLCDQIFTHFERQEDLQNLSGKLQDDLERIRHILDHATSNSILILNEVFSSTTFEDAVFLSKEILGKISDLDAYCVWVTFLDELSTFNEKTVSMVSTVKPDNAVERTYKIIRQPADGLAYAFSLAEKHRLTYRQIVERIRS